VRTGEVDLADLAVAHQRPRRPFGQDWINCRPPQPPRGLRDRQALAKLGGEQATRSASDVGVLDPPGRTCSPLVNPAHAAVRNSLDRDAERSPVQAFLLLDVNM
jgi:hypothetical protein